VIRAVLTDIIGLLSICVALYAFWVIGAGLTPTEYLP
jgi:hypothetical protein